MDEGPRLLFGHTPGHTLVDANVCLAGTRRAILRAVKYFDWDDAKNAKLRKERGIGFEDIVFHIERGDLLDVLEHPNPERYASQRIFVVQRDDYVYLVPFVEASARRWVAVSDVDRQPAAQVRSRTPQGGLRNPYSPVC